MSATFSTMLDVLILTLICCTAFDRRHQKAASVAIILCTLGDWNMFRYGVRCLWFLPFHTSRTGAPLAAVQGECRMDSSCVPFISGKHRLVKFNSLATLYKNQNNPLTWVDVKFTSPEICNLLNKNHLCWKRIFNYMGLFCSPLKKIFTVFCPKSACSLKHVGTGRLSFLFGKVNFQELC